MAEGVDLWCGEIVMELKDRYEPSLELIAVVPYLAQAEHMSEKNKERYGRLMSFASQRYLVSRQYTKACFQKRNAFLVDSSDAVIAVLSENEPRSGTAQTVRYAQKKDKKIFLLRP